MEHQRSENWQREKRMESNESILGSIRNALLTYDGSETHRFVREGIEAGVDPLEMVENGLTAAMSDIGERFGRGEVYLPELMQAANIMKSSIEILTPVIKASKGQGEEKQAIKIILGTVQGDIHDIGKNIVQIIFETAGFKVIDLGVDIPSEGFVDAALEHRPVALGMSALLTTTLPQIGKVIEAFEEADLRDRMKVIVGGSTLSQEYADQIGADAYGIDAVDGLNKLKAMIS